MKSTKNSKTLSKQLKKSLTTIYLETILKNRWIPHEPFEKQREFLLQLNEEVFYGGAAGPGKSDALLMAALQYVDIPGYHAILFRRTYSDLALPGALMDRAHEWLDGTEARWNGQEKTWMFPSGSTLSFGYLEHEKDKHRYQSAEFQFIGFDELTQFTETQYVYLFSRLRRLSHVKIPLRMRSASNPGNVGHEWVKNRFIIHGKEQGRVFIFAKLEDNPYLDRESYEKNLMKLDPVTRAQLMDGNWDIEHQGNMFKRSWFRISEDYPRSHSRSLRYWDLAATEPKKGQDPDYTVGLLMVEKDGVFWIVDVVRDRLSPKGVESLIKQTSILDFKRFRNYSISMEQEGGSGGKNTIDHYATNVLKGFPFNGVRSTGSKAERARPFSAALENGNVILVSAPWNNDFINELVPFPTTGMHDDQVDAASGAFNEINAKTGATPAFYSQ